MTGSTGLPEKWLTARSRAACGVPAFADPRSDDDVDHELPAVLRVGEEVHGLVGRGRRPGQERRRVDHQADHDNRHDGPEQAAAAAHVLHTTIAAHVAPQHARCPDRARPRDHGLRHQVRADRRSPSRSRRHPRTASTGRWRSTAHPMRIVSLDPGLSESLVALGLGSRLVGRSGQEGAPFQAPGAGRAGRRTGSRTCQKLRKLQPDLVLASPGRRVVSGGRRLAGDRRRRRGLRVESDLAARRRERPAADRRSDRHPATAPSSSSTRSQRCSSASRGRLAVSSRCRSSSISASATRSLRPAWAPT